VLQPHGVDRQSQLLWFILSIVGAILMLVGWYRWAF
jgi:hypothetical protein